VQIIDNKALLLKVKDPGRITTVIPKSKVLESGEVLVKWGLEEAQVLKNLRIKNVPSPIMAKYNWPGFYRPFAHQKATAEFLTLHRRAFVFNEQGTGKTGSVIWAADYLMNLGFIKRVLVLCPLSIMQSAWQNDLFKFAMHRTVGIAHSHSRDKRKKIVNSDVEFVICNFDGLEIIKDEVDKGGFNLIVVDECFVAGTLVATPLGRRPIEQLEAGDKVLTSDGVMCIKRLVRNTTNRLVEVKLGNGKTIKCTPEHPFFTDAGWVCAKNLAGRRLISGIELSCLRAGFYPRAFPSNVEYVEQPTPWADLFKILRTEEVPLSESRSQLLQQNVARATGETIRAKNTGASNEAIGGTEGTQPQTQSTRWKWQGHDINGTVDFRGITCGVGMELPSSVGWEAARLSYKLQARLCMAPSESRVRSGREQSYGGSAATARSQERGKVGDAWVESISYIECPDGEDVFNIEVEGTPNYFVGDHWLVHNCNAYKTISTRRWKVLNSIIKPNTWVWMMTGTPASQAPTDAYGLAKIINPSKVPRFFGSFRDMVMQKLTEFKWIPRPRAEEIVHQVLQPAIRFTKEECLDLPDMTYVTREVPLTAQQKKYYEEIRKHMVTVAAGEEITTVNAAANLNKLLQLSCGAVYSDSGEVIAFDSSNRIVALKEVIEEASHKVIVFVPYRHAIQIVHEELTKSGYTAEIISGSVSVGKRTDIFNRFQTEPDPKVLVIQPQAASHGVTLHAANVVIYWSPVMSVETYLQANARVHRAGQRNPCTVVHLQGSPVESRMYQMLQSKVDIHTRVVDLYKNLIEEG
jgi:superfamily II DNA or RNA helicase